MPRLALVIASLVTLTACGPTAPSPSPEAAFVQVVNVDGPNVDLLLDDDFVMSVLCDASVTLSPGDGKLPALPWRLTVRATDGEILGSVSVNGPLPRGVLIRGRSVLTGPWPMSAGPAPSRVGAPCGPGGSS